MPEDPPNSEPETSQPGPDWGRVADGVFLIGLGVFFLVAQEKGLPESFWLELVPFWPILLVSLGIRVLFSKTRMSWAIVLGPLVVLAALFWLGFGDRPPLPPPGEWRPLSADRPPDVDRARILADLASARLDLEARPLAPQLLADGRAASRDSEPRLQVSEDAGEATVRLRGGRSGVVMVAARREHWQLAVSSGLPVSTELEGAFISGNIDLRKGRLAYGAVGGAFNTVVLRLPQPQEPVRIRLEGAFNAFDVTVPEGTPVRIHGPGFPINYLEEGPAERGLSEDGPGYEVILRGVFNSLDIREEPAPQTTGIDG
jgi:hypothetical protein